MEVKFSCWLNWTAPKKKARDKVRPQKGRLIKRAWERNKRVMLLTQMAGLWGAVLGNSNMPNFLLVLSLKSILKSVLNVLHCTLNVISGVWAHAQHECAQTEWSISPFQSASISQQTQSQLKATAVGHFSAELNSVTHLRAHSRGSVAELSNSSNVFKRVESERYNMDFLEHESNMWVSMLSCLRTGSLQCEQTGEAFHKLSWRYRYSKLLSNETCFI